MANDSDVERVMDLFGRDVVARARDRVIDHFDRSVTTSAKKVPPTAMASIHARAADFRTIAALPTPQQEMIRRIVVEAVDEVIFNMLVLLHEQQHKGDADVAKLFIDKIELLSAAMDEMAWPGIFGNLTTEDGWFARFSKHGETGRAATS